MYRSYTGGGGQAVDKRAIEQKHVEIITESGIWRAKNPNLIWNAREIFCSCHCHCCCCSNFIFQVWHVGVCVCVQWACLCLCLCHISAVHIVCVSITDMMRLLIASASGNGNSYIDKIEAMRDKGKGNAKKSGGALASNLTNWTDICIWQHSCDCDKEFIIHYALRCSCDDGRERLDSEQQQQQPKTYHTRATQWHWMELVRKWSRIACSVDAMCRCNYDTLAYHVTWVKKTKIWNPRNCNPSAKHSHGQIPEHLVKDGVCRLIYSIFSPLEKYDIWLNFINNKLQFNR